jgi:hypothetical protein
VIASFINLQKLWYLPALSSHCPHHKHLEWLKLMRIHLWCIWLTNHKLKTSCPVKYEYPNLVLFYLESQASSCHCKYTRIIENRQRGTSVPDDTKKSLIWRIDKSKSNVLCNSKLLIGMYGGHFGTTWFLGVGCMSRAHTQYKMRASKRLGATN